MGDPLRIHLHLGAHKTATTHLQHLLRGAKGALRARDVHLSTPAQLRDEWLVAFNRYDRGRPWHLGGRHARRLRAEAPPAGTWLLSEENLIGVPRNLAFKKGLYPAAGRKLRHFRDLFPDADLRVFFAVRAYQDFYRSSYCEVVRHGGYRPFDAFYDGTRFSSHSWAELLLQFANVVPASHITVWKYEDFRSLEPLVIERLTGIPSGTLTLPPRRGNTHVSFSARALEAIRDLPGSQTRDEYKAAIRDIVKTYPSGDEFPPYDPWTPEQRRVLQERYERDLARIPRELPELRMLGNDGTAP